VCGGTELRGCWGGTLVFGGDEGVVVYHRVQLGGEAEGASAVIDGGALIRALPGVANRAPIARIDRKCVELHNRCILF
jgi:hypothetical protein